jgi:hypothetical protein|tara:strand:+ start:1715 stop:2098 length:384 start_codon:yes stop_codon:yes gene_type:complete
MVNKKRGYYSLSIGGKQRTLHFSMNFWAAFTDEMQISLTEIDQVFSNALNLNSIRALVYSGLLAYDQEEGNEIDYNIFKVGAWLDDINTDQFNEIINTLMESKLLGNELNGGLSRGAKPTSKAAVKK